MGASGSARQLSSNGIHKRQHQMDRRGPEDASIPSNAGSARPLPARLVVACVVNQGDFSLTWMDSIRTQNSASCTLFPIRLRDGKDRDSYHDTSVILYNLGMSLHCHSRTAPYVNGSKTRRQAKKAVQLLHRSHSLMFRRLSQKK